MFHQGIQILENGMKHEREALFSLFPMKYSKRVVYTVKVKAKLELIYERLLP